MNIDQQSVSTYSFQDWNEQLSKDPMLHKTKKGKLAMGSSEVVNDSIIDKGDFQLDLGTFLGEDEESKE